MPLEAWQVTTDPCRSGVTSICSVDLVTSPECGPGDVLLVEATIGCPFPRNQARRETGKLLPDSQVNVAVWPGRSFSGRTRIVTFLGGTVKANN